MAGQRGKVFGDEARRWVRGRLPTADYYAKVYAEERKRAEGQVDAAVRRRRSNSSSSAAQQTG